MDGIGRPPIAGRRRTLGIGWMEDAPTRRRKLDFGWTFTNVTHPPP